jgi:predicted nucleotidyltransferase
MRIPKEQLDFLKQQIKQHAPEAKVYLFGSRLDDQKRGGDIDIMVLTKEKLTN